MAITREKQIEDAGGAPISTGVYREPHSLLRPYIRGPYQGFVEYSQAPWQRREMPGAEVVLCLNLGPPWEAVHDGGMPAIVERYDSFLSGLHDSYTVIGSSGRSACLQINLTPFGAYLFFGYPMDTLAHRIVEFEDVTGAGGRELTDRLREATSWDARFDLLDSYFRRCLREAGSLSSPVEWAWDRLVETAGAIPIGDLTAEFGWSRKHFVSRFREHIGLSPKTAARILRFSRATRTITRTESESWSDLALECGYFDQAHLIRDFKQFAGWTPGEFVRSR